jgi:hypothetical protein
MACDMDLRSTETASLGGACIKNASYRKAVSRQPSPSAHTSLVVYTLAGAMFNGTLNAVHSQL